MATPPAQPMETSAAASNPVDSLKDDNIEDILLQLPSPASLARAALSSRRWRRVASNPHFLRRFRERHPSPPVLGLFVSQTDLGQLPVFQPSASVRSDPDLAAAARGGDFLLTRLEHDPAWRLRDCHNGLLLLCRGESLSVYDPVSHRHVAVRRPRNEPLPLSGTEYIADCLLHGEDGAAVSFRLVSVQREGHRMRAMEYRSGTPDWRCHPWEDGIDVPTLHTPAMPAAMAGLIFWRCDKNSSLLLDTSTMTFSTVPLPAPLVVLSTHSIRPRPVYGIGDTEAGECCLVVIHGRTTLQVWRLMKNDAGNGNTWELEKESQISELTGFSRRFRVYMVSAGQALVYCMGAKYSHFLIDLKTLTLKDKFLCHRSMAYPFQMTWPPAGLVDTSTPQTYACGDEEKQQEVPSCSRKRKSKDEVSNDSEKQQEASSCSRKQKSKEETSGGKETMEPSISTASLKSESSQKKFWYEPGPHLD